MNDMLRQIDELQKEINARRPLDKGLVKQIREYYRIGLTYTSNALEGNSLTESETKVVIEDGITIGGKRLIEHLEAVGHSQAYDFLYTCVNNDEFSEDDIQRFHHLFYYKINEQQAGVYRDKPVYITGSKHTFPAPEQVPELMAYFVQESLRDRASLHPVEFAAQAHKKFVFIHPFIDGNGRVARLLMNLVLLQMGYTIAIIPPIVRADYIRTLEKAHTDDRDFIDFIARMVKETQQDYLRMFS